MPSVPSFCPRPRARLDRRRQLARPRRFQPREECFECY